jgi:pimeloyl-ACP methyl ester carboxylesterase
MDLSFERRGEGARDVVLLVHGFPLDHTQWAGQLQGLAGWTRLAPDLRGVGRSAAVGEPASMAAYAADLIALLDRLGIGQAVCCGLSMGGYVLFELLRQRPDRVRALILCDTKAEADTPEGQRGRDELVSLARQAGSAAVVDRLLPKLLGATTRRDAPGLVESVRAMALGMPVEGMVGALVAMRDRPDSTSLLPTIDVPALVIGGVEDEITPPAGMRALAARIPGATFVDVPRAGHLAPLEQPGQVNAHLQDFLERL